MDIQIVIVLIVIGFMMVAMVNEIARPHLIMLNSLAALFLLGVISPAAALRGFSNEGMFTVALLFIVARAVQQSGILKYVVHFVLGQKADSSYLLARLMLPVAGLSAFLNNTPLVVMFTPEVRDWCLKYNLFPSKLLLPLSYAVILGGTMTLIGTSTNVLIHGMMIEQGLEGYSMFQLAIVGAPLVLVGTAFIATIGYRILPERRPQSEKELNVRTKEFLIEATVRRGGSIADRTVKEAGLRNLEGVYLIAIIRGENRLYPVPSDHVLQEGDRLIFTGAVSTIVDLQENPGLRLETGTRLSFNELKNGNGRLVEAVVSQHSPIVGKTIKQNRFRSRYQAGVVAVHRNQERIANKIGEIRLKPGDTLLLLAKDDFIAKWRTMSDFYVITSVDLPEMNRGKHPIVTLVLLLLMIVLVVANVLTMLESALFAVIALIAMRILSIEEAKKSIQWNVLLIIACAIGIGAGLEQSGAANWLAGNLLKLTAGVGVLGLLVALYLLTTLFTELMTNNAAAALMFPIAFSAAKQFGADPLPFFVTITISASCCFMTPIGYQTNLIVYGSGGYRFSDYIKVGIPLSILCFLTTVSIVYAVWF